MSSLRKKKTKGPRPPLLFFLLLLGLSPLHCVAVCPLFRLPNPQPFFFCIGLLSLSPFAVVCYTQYKLPLFCTSCTKKTNFGLLTPCSHILLCKKIWHSTVAVILQILNRSFVLQTTNTCSITFSWTSCVSTAFNSM